MWIDPRPVYTVEQVAKITKTSKSWWRKAIREGKVNIVRFGRSVRITREELERIISEGGIK